MSGLRQWCCVKARSIACIATAQAIRQQGLGSHFCGCWVLNVSGITLLTGYAGYYNTVLPHTTAGTALRKRTASLLTGHDTVPYTTAAVGWRQLDLMYITISNNRSIIVVTTAPGSSRPPGNHWQGSLLWLVVTVLHHYGCAVLLRVMWPAPHRRPSFRWCCGRLWSGTRGM